MRLSSTAAFLALSSLGASYVLPFISPQQVNDHLMRRKVPYAVVNVDGNDDQITSTSTSSSSFSLSSSSTSPVTQTSVETVTTSSPPPPPVTVTVTTTASSTPMASCRSSSTPVSSSKVPSSSSIGTLKTVSSPRLSGSVSSIPSQMSSF